MGRKRVLRTSAPLYPEYPESEHLWRISRLRHVMKEDGLDALVLARNANVFYATGTRFVFVGMDAPAAGVPQSTAVIAQDADIYCQRFGPFDTDAVGLQTAWSESLEFYDDELELVSILRDYGIGRGARIGMEWGPGLCVGINPIKFMMLRDKISKELGAEVVDATTTMWKVTAIKSELEIERMRVSVAAAARAMDRILDCIEIGMNELEVSRMASRFMMEEGGDRVAHSQVMAQGSGTRFGSCDALDRPIERGWVRLDIGCKYRRYGSDISREVFLGREPTPKERRFYECRKGANEVLDRLIKPDICMDEVLHAMKQYVEDCGCVLLENRGSIFGGHAIGLENYQRPNFVLSAAQPEFQNREGRVLFKAGMMFAYEMPIRLPGFDASFDIEDDVVVTEHGVENMNATLTREIRVKL